MQTVLQRRADATLKRELQAAKESYQYRLRELQDRSREQALRKIAKELVRQRVEAQQLTLFEELQQEAEMGVQELEEQVAVLRQDVERTRQLLTRERDNRINVVLPKRFQIAGSPGLAVDHDLSGSGCQGGFAAMSQADTCPCLVVKVAASRDAAFARGLGGTVSRPAACCTVSPAGQAAERIQPFRFLVLPI